ncbi:MAG: ribulose-phosphate 3-epimerase [Clostridiales bacterium]|nr:ribulose-phosphate 3-epimerase [Clostridiales bacterium]
MIELAPSLLAADLLRLETEIERMLQNGVKTLHFDVMDAHFVPNLSFGPALCQAIHARFPECRLDVHLMMDNPLDYLSVFARAGAWAITLHREPLADPRAAMREIRALGARAGLSVKPGTAVETLLPCMDEMDLALIMTVEPGFGGQKFKAEQAEKIRALRRAGFTGDISVDGGVSMENARMLVGAGASMLVMGTAYFRAADPAGVARAVRELV